MAAFGQAPDNNSNISPPPRPLSSKRALPNGPCNYRDFTIGSCGCYQFWDQISAELHEDSTESRSRSERSTWCVCGHHACFHQLEPRATDKRVPSQLAPASTHNFGKYDAHRQSQAAHPGHNNPPLRRVEEGTQAAEGSQRSQRSRARGASQAPRPRFSQQSTVHGSAASARNTRNAPSQGVSSLPPVPSVCLLNSNDLRTISPSGPGEVRPDQNGNIDNGLTGLGLSGLFQYPETNSDNQQSLSATSDRERSRDGSQIPSTNANSVSEENLRRESVDMRAPDPEYYRNLPQLDVGDTIPSTYNPEDYIASATEVATPRSANTPNLQAADKVVNETTKLVDALSRLHGNVERDAAGTDARPTSSPSAAIPQLLLTNSPPTPHEQLQQALRSASPQVIQRIASFLGPLHNLLSSMPNANTIRELTHRIETLEGNSFTHVAPEDLNQAMDLVDGRIIELEHRMDDHEKLHAAIDADQSSRDNFPPRRRGPLATDSFGSNHSASAQSVTSSALIVAAIDHKEIDTRMEGIEDRLGALEAAAMPTVVDPWQVEVVLLPWGRDLKGIWYSADDPMHDQPGVVTQDAEEWTQPRSSRSHRSSSRSSLPAPEAEGGWSSQAITEWADTMDKWLSPKACGSNNLVYKRLQSRGFIRTVTFKGANSKDIQTAITAAFADLLEHLEDSQGPDEEALMSYDEAADSHAGLKAAFIPLRKVLKSSRLRYLTPAEMSSSALWNAQFLSSGVMMRVSGGQKRLYVTQREAYLQASDYTSKPWKWQRLRELPRFHANTDTVMEGNGVLEGDAKETCWMYTAALDPPLSVTSSFSSTHSHNSLSLRLVELDEKEDTRPRWRRSITPSSRMNKTKPHQPISPLSEHHPRRPLHHRTRTNSTSVLDEGKANTQGSTKRRLHTSMSFNDRPQLRRRNTSHSNIPASQFHSSSRAPSITSHQKQPKRRRLTRSPEPDHHTSRGPLSQAGVAFFANNTPRRSREPPSPFFSSQREVDAGSVGKGTQYAYATPFSGLVGGGGSNEGGENGDGDTEVDDGGSWHGVDNDDDNDNASAGHQEPREAEVEESSEDELTRLTQGGSFRLRQRAEDDIADFSDEGGDSGFGGESDDDPEFDAQVMVEEEGFVDEDGSGEEDDDDDEDDG